VRSRRQRRRRLDRRLADAARLLSGQQPQDTGHHRVAGNGGVHRRRGGDRKRRSSGSGDLGGALAPTVTGFIVEATGSFVAALLASAALGPISALAYLVVIRAEPITTAELDATAGARARGS